MQIIDHAPEEQQDVYVSSFSNVFVDEAHHIVATSWRKFSDRFPRHQLVQFTATPFRNDGQRLDGKIIFNYPLRQAQKMVIIALYISCQSGNTVKRPLLIKLLLKRLLRN